MKDIIKTRFFLINSGPNQKNSTMCGRLSYKILIALKFVRNYANLKESTRQKMNITF